MAKKKKKSGGGGFGKARSAKQAVTPMRGFHENYRSAEPMLKMIRRISDGSNFESPEELQRFLNQNIIGKTMEEIARIADEISPLTPVEKADRLIDELPADSTNEQIIHIAREALAISPCSLSAWLMLGNYEPDDAKALEHFEEGVTRGKERFKNEIESIHDNLGLWGHVAARDLIRLMIGKAQLLQGPETIDQAIATYREILKLNPSDNRGARGSLLLLLLIKRELKDARALLDDYPNDGNITMAWGRAFVSITEALDRTGYELPQDDETLRQFKNPQGFVKSLGPEFDQVKKDIHSAATLNPFVPMLFNESGLYAIELSDTMAIGGPYEAVQYLRLWAALWSAAGLPMAFLLSATPKSIKKYLKNRVIADELLEIAAQLEDYDGPPWWKAIDELDPDQAKKD